MKKEEKIIPKPIINSVAAKATHSGCGRGSKFILSHWIMHIIRIKLPLIVNVDPRIRPVSSLK